MSKLKIVDQPDCGNAPRRELVRELTTHLAAREASLVTAFLSDDVEWSVNGNTPMRGTDAVEAWISAGPALRELRFGAILSHGREASIDGVMVPTSGALLPFSVFFRFTSTAKTAPIAAVRSYFVERRDSPR
ncbi:hypothetical protein [Humidisolicoccus flavus]|uniref:hypothetical protein n=1 Tax=Humidisolicoccus flavus TaxID=3111414 RepID=UPI00324DF6C9